jgi:hypothetical protein
VQDGRRTIKKDGSGFWTVKYNARQDDTWHNPYVFPCAMSQVFFMHDRLQLDWRVVIRSEARNRRRVDENHYIVFGTGGAAEEYDLAASYAQVAPLVDGDVVDDAVVRAVGATLHLPEDNAHLRDLQYVDDEDED